MQNIWYTNSHRSFVPPQGVMIHRLESMSIKWENMTVKFRGCRRTHFANEESKDFRDTLFLFPVGWVKEAVRNTGSELLDCLSLLHTCFGLQEFPGTCQLQEKWRVSPSLLRPTQGHSRGEKQYFCPFPLIREVFFSQKRGSVFIFA